MNVTEILAAFADLLGLVLVVVLLRRSKFQLSSGRRLRQFRQRVLGSRAGSFGLVCTIVAGLLLVGPATPAFALGDCKDAPGVEAPGDGLVGSLDGGSAGLVGGKPAQGTAGTPYGDYGYAGLTWQTYDLGCGGDARDPVTAATSWISNQLFNVSKVEVATYNGLHYGLLNPGSFDWLDSVTSSIGADLFSGIFVPWIGLALLVLAVLLFGYAARSDLAGLSRRASWGVLALAFAAGTASTPLVYESFVRSTVIDLSNDAANGLLKDSSARDAVPDYLVNGVIYPSWLQGEVGTTHGPIVDRYAPVLLPAKACSKAEAAGTCNEAAKQEQFTVIAADLGNNSSNAYHALQGRTGDRLSSAGRSVVTTTIATSFQMIALIVLILSILTVAIMVLLGSVVGLLAVLNPDTMRNVFRVFGTALINAVVMAVLAGIHARLVLWVTAQTNIPWILGEIGLAVITVLLMMIAQPFKRAKAMLHAVLDTIGGTSSPSGLLGRRGSERAASPSEEFWQHQRENDFEESTTSIEPGIQSAVAEEQAGIRDGRESLGLRTPLEFAHPAIGWSTNATPSLQTADDSENHGLFGFEVAELRPMSAGGADSAIEPSADMPAHEGRSDAEYSGEPAATAVTLPSWYHPDSSHSDVAAALPANDGQTPVITRLPHRDDLYMPVERQIESAGAGS